MRRLEDVLERAERAWAAHDRAVALAFALVVALLHASVTEPRHLFCDDIATSFLPFQRYTYLHPWDAFRGVPTPGFHFGTQIHDHDLPAALPLLPALLARLAPSDLMGLALFEWRLTSLCVLFGVAGAHALLRHLGTTRPVALAMAIGYPLFYSVSREYQIVHAQRAKLLLPLVALATLLALRRRTPLATLAAAAAWIVCLGQIWQSYWMVAMALAAATASAAGAFAQGGVARLRRDVPRRREALVLVALGAAPIALALGPPFLRFQRALAGSAWLERLASSGEVQLAYMRQGAGWLSPAGIVVPVPSAAGPLGALSPLTVAGLALAGHLLLARATRRRALDLAIPRAAAVALGAALAALPFLVLERLPASWLSASGDRVLVLGVVAPRALATLVHTTDRTWMGMLEACSALASAVLLAAWANAPRAALVRLVDVAGASLVYALAVLLLGRAGASVPGGELAAIVALVAGCLAVVALSSHDRSAIRVAASAVLPALALLFFGYRWPLVLEGIAGTSRGASMRELQARIDAAPAEAKHQFRYRIGVLGDPRRTALYTNVALLFDAPGTTSYDARRLSPDLLSFLTDVGATDASHLPYEARLDYARLEAAGILPLLGVRWFVAPESREAPPFVPPGAREVAPGVYEDARAFPKAWAVERWEVEPERAAATRRVLALGARGALGAHGVLAVDPGVPPPSAPGAAAARVEVAEARPGELVLRTRSTAPFVVATNEIARAGWTVTVDGAPSSVARVNAVFVGAIAPGGDHELRLAVRVD